MPIYEYVCGNCKEKFDALRPYKDADAPIACSECGSVNTTRKLSVFFAQSGGKVVAGNSSPSCSGCAGGSCAGCGH